MTKTSGHNSSVGRLLFLAVLFCCLFGRQLEAQSGAATEKLAFVLSNDDLPASVAVAGAKLFSDKNYKIKQLPGFLSGTHYLVGPMDKGMEIVPVTAGLLYMITPLKGNKGSQEELLIGEGFIRMDYPSFTLYKGQKEKIGVFKKEIKYDNFRLKRFRHHGWAIAFSDSSSLPSVTTAAGVIWSPGKEYARNTRQWQGCPSIELTGKRLWGAWFSGGSREPSPGNYGIVSYSDNSGSEWIDPALVIVHPDHRVRVMDTQLWKDPEGRLWIFWTQNTGEHGFDGLWGTWAITIDDPEKDIPVWTSPRRLCDGLTRNKPVVHSSGEWLLPSYDWIKRQSALYLSKDKGTSWTLQGGPSNKDTNFYEQMCVELKDGRIWMLQRNIQESISEDKGATWTDLKQIPELASANSRLYIGRLRSGNLILVYNEDPERKARKNMVARLSTDDGRTWPYKLLLDERNQVSYPDAVQDENGLIYVCYDRSRTGEKEILLAIFTEEDIVQGRFITKDAAAKKIISKVAE